MGRSLTQEISGIFVSISIPTTGAQGLQIHLLPLAFTWILGGPNFCPHAYMENSFSAEPNISFWFKALYFTESPPRDIGGIIFSSLRKKTKSKTQSKTKLN